MTVFTFDVAAFRLAYPAFDNDTAFPEATLQAYWNSAVCYISPTDYGDLSGPSRFLALNLMTAHLTALSVIIAGGQVPGLMQASAIDKVNVTLTPPVFKNQWQWWLSLTPYGQQLFALLQVISASGFYVGGSPQRSAFRGIGSC